MPVVVMNMNCSTTKRACGRGQKPAHQREADRELHQYDHHLHKDLHAVVGEHRFIQQPVQYGNVGFQRVIAER